MKYKMVGTLMVKGTGKALIEDGKEVKAESEEFIPETPDGTVKVMFKIKNKGLANNLLVAFEECYLMDDQPVIQEEPADDETGDKEQSAGDEGQPTGDESQSTDDEGQPAGDEGQEQGDDNEQTVTHEFVPEVVAEHLDINDVNQTVGIPDIKTVLKTKNGKKVISKKNTTLKDTVKYTNLVPGTTYTMKATLMNKSTKKPVMNNGKPVTGTAKFTPKTPNGSVEVTMNVNVKNLNGKSLVAFEECYEKEVVIAAHKDLNDKDQTVKVKLPKKHKKHSRHPKTGDKTRFLVLLLAAGVIIVTAGGYVVYRRRSQKKMQ